MGSVGLALKLVNNRSIHDPIEQRHRHRRISQVLAPPLKVDVRDQGRAPLASSAVNHLVQQAGGLGMLLTLQLVKAQFVDDQ